MKNKKVVAGFELVVMLVGIFAFAYGISMTDEIFEKLAEPMIPLVSAVDYDAGCCAVSTSGEKCATTSAGNCGDGENFAQGALCSETSFCQKGCCYDEFSGIFDNNVLEGDCVREWLRDPNCNLHGAKKGCCVLGSSAIYETQGQCETDTLVRALGNSSVVDWRADLNEMQCFAMSATQEEGACLIGGGECKFVSEVECLNYGGDFNKGYLCSSPSFGTGCNMTEETICVDGKDGVYFVDSCGNYANVYDASKVNDPDYWDTVVEADNVCGAGDTEGNANSKTCGNCNRFLGGVCASGLDNNFNADVGNYYCKDTSCMFDGETYENGESWCVYDGKIGDGDDVVGSRHWKYVCSQGMIQVEPCADYRNQICVQSNEVEVEINGSNVNSEFRNAACVANNWRECIGQGGGCDGTLNCRTESIQVSEHFSFEACTPKYPGGFSFRDERYQTTAGEICNKADQTCTVVYQADFWGKCKVVANEECLTEKFANEMNEYCRKLGDCGGAVNIEGVFSGSYSVSGAPGISNTGSLSGLANAVKGQFAEVEDYTKYLEAAGVIGNGSGINDFDEDGNVKSPSGAIFGAAAGIGGLGYAAGVTSLVLLGKSIGGAVFLKSLTAVSLFGGRVSSALPFMSGFAGAAIGASIGMVAGTLLAKAVGASPLGTVLMASGGALIGGAIGVAFVKGALSTCLAPGACLLVVAIGLILLIVGLFFGAKDCENVEVSFECKPWQPPAGGSDCEKCNGDLLKPCSDYRCQSLGAACNIINKGTDHELCIDENPNDASPPILNPSLGTISGSEKYDDITVDGFKVTSLEGGCVDAYTPLTFGVNTDEPAQCKFDVGAKDFDDMIFDLGTNAFTYNHTTTFPLPDPSHGQSQGSNWTGELDLYIKCRDTHGNENPGFYNVEMCVNEGPDRMGPVVVATDPANDALINYDSNVENVTFITNELADCKWDVNDVGYSDMANVMTCGDTLNQPSSPRGYVCFDELATDNIENNYYVSCLDQPWLNDSSDRNSRDFVYRLRKPENPISIDWIEPSEDFEISTDGTTIELQVQTSGGGEAHFCAYSFSGYDKMIDLFETGGNRIHKQPLNRPAGRNRIYVECRDETGASDQSSTSFKIVHDTSTPQIARVWQSGGNLNFITTEDADCRYSTTTCRFKWADGELADEGTDHEFSVVRGETYYIKCEDEFGNAPSGCSISLRAL